MKTTLALSAVVAAIAVFSQGALAQSASSPTRAEVKAEAKAANKAPQGDAMTKEGGGQPSKTSDTTRDARKATTKAEAKSGKLDATGDAMTKEGKGAPPKTSDHDQGSAQGRHPCRYQVGQDGADGRRHDQGRRQAEAVIVFGPPTGGCDALLAAPTT